MILLLDNFDSFTYNLRDYLAQAGAKCKVFRNDADPKEIFKENYKGVVLSPGPGRPQYAGCLMKVIHHYKHTHPILGICLGHQAIGAYFGAKLEKAEIPMHGKISKVFQCDDELVFRGMPEEINVVRYHSWVLTDIPTSLKTTAVTLNKEVMAIKHQSLPIYGLQFHPEAVLTEKGFQMLHNWVKFYQLGN